jgi:hypothetical protein
MLSAYRNILPFEEYLQQAKNALSKSGFGEMTSSILSFKAFNHANQLTIYFVAMPEQTSTVLISCKFFEVISYSEYPRNETNRLWKNHLCGDETLNEISAYVLDHPVVHVFHCAEVFDDIDWPNFIPLHLYDCDDWEIIEVSDPFIEWDAVKSALPADPSKLSYKSALLTNIQPQSDDSDVSIGASHPGFSWRYIPQLNGKKNPKDSDKKEALAGEDANYLRLLQEEEEGKIVSIFFCSYAFG